MAFCHNLAQFSLTVVIELLHFRLYLERIIRITAKVLHRIYICAVAKRSTMSLHITLIAAAVGLQSALTHYGLADDKSRTSVAVLCLVEGTTYLVDIVSIYCHDVPAPRLILCGSVLVHNDTALRRQLYIV